MFGAVLDEYNLADCGRCAVFVSAMWRSGMIWLSQIFIGLCNFLAPMVGIKRVAELDTQEVVALLEQAEDSVVLVDVRSEPEIAVSMLPGAITRAEFEQNRQAFAGRIVVPYCTVGGRSLVYAWKLADQGIDVRNYRGS